MASKSEFNLELVIRAVDRATAPLQKIGAALQRSMKPMGAGMKALHGQAIVNGFRQVGTALMGIGTAAWDTGQRLFNPPNVAGWDDDR